MTSQGCRETIFSAVWTDSQEVAQRDERVLTLYRVGGLASCDVWDAGSILEQSLNLQCSEDSRVHFNSLENVRSCLVEINRSF